ncbi:MAG TPA: hypothetical protein VES66_09990 [Terriglobales bacterium]|nr:hypothetical protein [Terriglobales bacterium]
MAMYRTHKSLVLMVFLLLGLALPRAVAETCSSASEMDEATRSALERTARQFFDYASKGDVFDLKQSAIASLASNFGNIEAVVVDQRPIYAGAQATVRASYLLEASGAAPIARAEFLCGVWATPGWASFAINNLPPGRYGLVIQDIGTPSGKYALTTVLKQEGGAWKLAGYYSKPAEVGGHDGQWFLTRAREHKAKGANHNAWFYYLTAWDLTAPVDFISTPRLDKLSDEMQSVRPSDLPTSDHPLALGAGGGRTYQLIHLSALPVGNDLDLLVKYHMPDVSNTQQTFDDNMAVIRAIVGRYPEFRDAFAGVVARATEPSGRDYGTLLAMKDVK